jgi:formylglycine-generating enzyme
MSSGRRRIRPNKSAFGVTAALALIWTGLGFVAADEGLKRPADAEVSPSTKMPLILIPGGTFSMGVSPDEVLGGDNERPQHRVTISRPFFLGKYEVTQREFERVMGFNPSEIPGGEAMPVTKVSWYDAILFCNRLSKMDRLDEAYKVGGIVHDGKHVSSAKVELDLAATGYRLPTEAEWEYASRAGTVTPLAIGSKVGRDDANFDTATESPYLKEVRPARNLPVPVHSFQPNQFGLYQMMGNVFEWVWDAYGPYDDEPQTDPTGPEANDRDERIRRSGGYMSPAHHMRCALRHGVPANFSLFHGGFRVARTASGNPLK